MLGVLSVLSVGVLGCEEREVVGVAGCVGGAKGGDTCPHIAACGGWRPPRPEDVNRAQHEIETAIF